MLKDISGVWNASNGSGLTTINYADSRLQIIEGERALAATVGDVDPDNETVNLKLMANGKDEILTIRKAWNADHTAYNLSLIGPDGRQGNLGFVRKIGNDDLNRIARLSAAAPISSAANTGTPQAQPVQPANANRGVINMYLGGIDMNMRSCPGSTCAALIVVPKDSKISADTSTIRNVTETSGVNTPWVRVTYEGSYCTPAELDQQTGCTPTRGTDAPVTGWMNYTRLLDAPRPQQ